jgi:hypothetical protein
MASRRGGFTCSLPGDSWERKYLPRVISSTATEGAEDHAVPGTSGSPTMIASPSILRRKTSTPTFGSCSTSPVRRSNAHACHGHSTLPFSRVPSASGPCRCGHMLSTAASRPSSFARQSWRPPIVNSRREPGAGASPLEHSRTKRKVALPFSMIMLCASALKHRKRGFASDR